LKPPVSSSVTCSLTPDWKVCPYPYAGDARKPLTRILARIFHD
jgi:hypothetical protein